MVSTLYSNHRTFGRLNLDWDFHWQAMTCPDSMYQAICIRKFWLSWNETYLWLYWLKCTSVRRVKNQLCLKFSPVSTCRMSFRSFNKILRHVHICFCIFSEICPAPLTIPFANAPTVTESGTVAMYFCQAGYRIMNGGGATSQTIRCNVPTMSWPVIACERK